MAMQFGTESSLITMCPKASPNSSKIQNQKTNNQLNGVPIIRSFGLMANCGKLSLAWQSKPALFDTADQNQNIFCINVVSWGLLYYYSEFCCCCCRYCIISSGRRNILIIYFRKHHYKNLKILVSEVFKILLMQNLYFVYFAIRN